MLLPVMVIQLLAVACGSSLTTIEVLDPWARPSPPGTDTTSIYVVLTNRSETGLTLVDMKTDRCRRIEFHRTELDDDGVASMVPAERHDLTFGPGQELAFEPNALHVMCIGLEDPFVVGETFDVELHFAEGDGLTTAVTVRRP